MFSTVISGGIDGNRVFLTNVEVDLARSIPAFDMVGLHYTAFANAIREDSRQTAASRGVSPRKKFAVRANVESRVKIPIFCRAAEFAAKRPPVVLR